jgi:hypothetical protein
VLLGRNRRKSLRNRRFVGLASGPNRLDRAEIVRRYVLLGRNRPRLPPFNGLYSFQTLRVPTGSRRFEPVRAKRYVLLGRFRPGDTCFWAGIRLAYVLLGRFVRASGQEHTCFRAGSNVPLGRNIRASGQEIRRKSLSCKVFSCSTLLLSVTRRNNNTGRTGNEDQLVAYLLLLLSFQMGIRKTP